VSNADPLTRVPRCRKCGAQEEIYRIEGARVSFPLFEVSKGGLPICGDPTPDLDAPVEWDDLGLHCQACDEWITPDDVEMVFIA